MIKPLFWIAVNLIGFIILVFMYIRMDKRLREKTLGLRLFECLQIAIMAYLIFDMGMYMLDGTTL